MAASALRGPLIAAISSMRLLVVSGFAAGKLALLVAHAQQHAPAARARVAAAGAVGEHLDFRQLGQATSSRGSLKIMRSGVWSACSSLTVEARAERVDHLAHQHFRRRSAGGESRASRACQASPSRCRRRARSAARGRPSARRPRPAAANCCCWARRSPASGRIRRRSP